MKSMKLAFFGALCMGTSALLASLPVGAPAPLITLNGETGGRTNGSPWSSEELKGKVHVLFYVAPSEKDLNKEATDALKAKNFPDTTYASVAVVNMQASWIPDMVLSKKIASSQEEFPRTTYVKDVKGAFVSTWNLPKKSNDVIVFDKAGKVIFSQDGKLTTEDISKLVSVIESSL